MLLPSTLTERSSVIPGDFGIASTRPAVPGEMISLFGTGFGPSSPPVPAGVLPTEPEPLVGSPQVNISYYFPKVNYAGIVGPGLVQLNVVVPNVGSNGPEPIQVSVNGVYSPQDQALYLPISIN